jgi:hypothetical protein
MTLFISKPIDITSIKQEFDLAIVYAQPKIYKQLSTHKVLLNEEGKIVQENFFKSSSQKITFEMQKQISFRLFLIQLKAITHKQTLNMYGKQKAKIVKSYNRMIFDTKQHIFYQKSVDLSEIFFYEFHQTLWNIFLECVVFLEGKRFVAIYKESLEILWNLSQSFFQIFLYQHFIPIQHYNHFLSSYGFHFCVDFIRKNPFSMRDVDENYILLPKSIAVIYKMFSETLATKLNKEEFNLYNKVEAELIQFENFTTFEIDR